MVSARYGARLSQTDVVELAQASEHLAQVAATIKRANPVWADSTVQVLIVVNQLIVRLQNKGAAAYARYLERHGTKTGQGDSEEFDPADYVSTARERLKNEEED